jgi:putative MATE family efflux protein
LAAGGVFRKVLAQPGVAEGAIDYIRYIRWSVVFIGIGGSIQGVMNAMRRTRAVMVITVAANVLNVFLNWMFIFGRLGAPAMGLAGAGLATLVSQFFQASALVFLMIFSPSLAPYRKESLKPEKGLTRRVASMSLPIAVQNGLALLIFLAFDTVVENLGTIYLAVTQVVFSFYRINKTLVGGFARGAGIIAGNALGADDAEGARRVTAAQQKLGLGIGLAVMVLVLSVPGSLVRIFTSDADVIELGSRALRFFAVFFLVEISAFSLEIIFQSVGWARFVLFSEFSTNIVFILGATLLLVRFTDWGIWAAWTGFALYQVGHALILSAGWLSGRWLKTGVDA